MNKYAPIVIFVYKRYEHTFNLLNTLSKCVLAGESEIFIFADGARTETDSEEVSKVRELINEDRWKEHFQAVSIFESNQNKGLANSIIAGVSQIIEKYGKIIVLEDDLMLAPQFLEYMNQALDYFEADNRVFSIAGWTYPLKGFDKYEKDAWIYYRASSWGWATWLDRWEKVEFDAIKADFAGKLADKNWCEKFSRGGNDLPGMLQMQLDGKRDSWAIRWNAATVDLNMMTIYPVAPVVMNMGRDGSGTHCGIAEYEQMEFDDRAKDIYCFDDIKPCKKLINEAWSFDSDTLTKKIRRNVRKIFVEHKVPNCVKKVFGAGK